MQLKPKDWKTVGLTRQMITQATGLKPYVLIHIGRGRLSQPSIDHLARTVTAFPEKRDALLALFKDKFGPEVANRISKKCEKLVEVPQNNYREKFNDFIIRYLTTFVGSTDDIPEAVQGTARELDVSVDEVLEAIRRKLKKGEA